MQLEKVLLRKEKAFFTSKSQLSTNLESSRTLESGSPVSFMVPQRLTANARPVLIRQQLITDCPASVLGKDRPPDEAISYGHVILSLLAQPSNGRRLLERLSRGWSEEAACQWAVLSGSCLNQK